jgi:solute carrier family 32 (vesicular inhibitory amino acid transporter)
MGVGLLSVPLALSKSGYAGILVLWLLAIVTNYTGKALCRCAITVTNNGALAKGGMVRYEDIASAAFGTLGKRIVATVMYTELVGTCALLLILESDNLWNLLGPHLLEQGSASLGGLGQLVASQKEIFWLATALVVPTVCAPNVKSLSFLGLCGFVATMTVTCAIAIILFTGVFCSCCLATKCSIQQTGLVMQALNDVDFAKYGHSCHASG